MTNLKTPVAEISGLALNPAHIHTSQNQTVCGRGMEHIFPDTVLLLQILLYGKSFVKCSHLTSPYMNLKLHSAITTVTILPAEIRLCAVSAYMWWEET